MVVDSTISGVNKVTQLPVYRIHTRHGFYTPVFISSVPQYLYILEYLSQTSHSVSLYQTLYSVSLREMAATTPTPEVAPEEPLKYQVNHIIIKYPSLFYQSIFISTLFLTIYHLYFIFNVQKWVLRVSIHCEGCKRKVKKVLQSIEGN